MTFAPIQVLSLRHRRPEPVHAATVTAIGPVAVCGIGKAGLFVPTIDGDPIPFELRQEGEPAHCPKCEAVVSTIAAGRVTR